MEKQQATTTCKHKGWDEKPFQQDSETVKMTEVKFGVTMTGDWAGETEARYLMAYTEPGPCYYNGMERFEGTLNGKKGAFVLEHKGVYKDNEAATTFDIVPGSGTGELEGISGNGGYKAGHQESWEAWLAYSV